MPPNWGGDNSIDDNGSAQIAALTNSDLPAAPSANAASSAVGSGLTVQVSVNGAPSTTAVILPTVNGGAALCSCYDASYSGFGVGTPWQTSSGVVSDIDPDVDVAGDGAGVLQSLSALVRFIKDNPGQAAIQAAGIGAMLVPGLGEGALAAEGAGALSDAALVCRGGTCTATRFANGSGVSIDSAGNLQGVSVNSANVALVEDLTVGIPNGQVGVTTVGEIRAAGGDVIPSATAGNPFHCTLCGISPAEAEDLFTPTIPNPNR